MKYYVLDGSILNDCQHDNQIFNRMISYINDHPADRLVFLNVQPNDFNKLRFLNCCLLVEIDIVFKQKQWQDSKTQVALYSDVLQFNELVYASYRDALMIIECNHQVCQSELIYFDFFISPDSEPLDPFRSQRHQSKTSLKN